MKRENLIFIEHWKIDNLTKNDFIKLINENFSLARKQGFMKVEK